MRTRSPITHPRNFQRGPFSACGARDSLTRIALLEDIVTNGCWDLARVKKLLKPRSATQQANEAFRDGSS
jgi:hypothetical protein